MVRSHLLICCLRMLLLELIIENNLRKHFLEKINCYSFIFLEKLFFVEIFENFFGDITET